MKKVNAMDIYKLLPKTNCKKCGYPSCMAFATKLLEREANIDQCPILNTPKFEKNKKKILELISPPVKEVWFGNNERKAVLGGEEVMYRFQLTFFNPTAIGIDISDNLPEEEIKRRAKEIEDFVFERTGEKLRLDFIAIRNASRDKDKFINAIKIVEENTKMPICLVSLDPKIIEEALKVVKSKVMVYAATKDNLDEMIKVIKRSKKDVVLVLSSSDVKDLKNMANKCLANGIEDLVLEPTTYPENIIETLDLNVIIRRAAIEREDKLLGFPILNLPIVAYYYALNNSTPIDNFFDDKEIVAKIFESSIASTLINRYADALIMHSTDIWALMPVLTLRQCIYTDPRKPQAVEPGLYVIGNPDENSPVILTTNFSLTFYTVVGDFEKDKVNCWLLVMDTGGRAVDVSVAGGQYNGENAKKLIEETKIAEKVNHRIIILPALAASTRGDIEDKTGWTCVVGTRDSSQVGEFLRKNWDRILNEWRKKHGKA
ncbi:acetyl-CoA decarbonylase/synthase complex subunit gamma [Methanocaldococcus villosus]|uniref:acetyl-CoA decarbonylase/synthase complex subunit gamma n=1 Tax=Methanocaldococcus villosus TaxID=667126 RepID=UPI00036C0181|nr:acetyl-CoA decarbonylase/synthase complex subunit gamma [Methanocaldococcus villosus]